MHSKAEYFHAPSLGIMPMSDRALMAEHRRERARMNRIRQRRKRDARKERRRLGLPPLQLAAAAKASLLARLLALVAVVVGRRRRHVGIRK